MAAVIPGGFVLRPATRGDLRATAAAHVRLLPVGLFPSMGPRFVRRWHRTFLDSPHGVAFVVVDPRVRGRGVVAFLLGSVHHAAYMEMLLADRRAVTGLAVRGALALLGRPRVARHFARTRARPWLHRLVRRRAGSSPEVGPVGIDQGQIAVLSAIAVEPEMRGHRLGMHLVARFLLHAGSAGAEAAELVTDTGANGAPGFYERCGWTAVDDRVTRDGTVVRTYRYWLGGLPPRPLDRDERPTEESDR